MRSAALDNLVRNEQLKSESPVRAEIDALIHSGLARLTEAANEGLALESPFDLAYNAAHALSLAALRWHGYRPAQLRYIVFQCLPHTLGIPPEQWRVLDRASQTKHQRVPGTGGHQPAARRRRHPDNARSCGARPETDSKPGRMTLPPSSFTFHRSAFPRDNAPHAPRADDPPTRARHGDAVRRVLVHRHAGAAERRQHAAHRGVVSARGRDRGQLPDPAAADLGARRDRKSTRLNSSHRT